MSQMIDPALHALYDYELDQTSDSVTIIIKHAPHFNPAQLTVALDPSGESLAIEIGTGPPLVSGKLHQPFQSDYQLRSTPEDSRILFRKLSPGPWPLVIENRTADRVLDPKSAYLLYVLYTTESSDPDDQRTGLDLLRYSAEFGFTPGLRAYGHHLLANGDREDGLNFLKIAAHQYHDAESVFNIGLIFIHSPDKAHGVAYLQQASHYDFLAADFALGRLFSPLCGFAGFTRKNAATAFVHLEKASRDPGEMGARALYELARLHLEGLGTPKNVRVAVALARRARAVCPELPEIAVKETEAEGGGGAWWIGGLCAGAVAVFGFAVVRHLRKRHQ
jgi:TPR repeat protein